MELNEEDDEVAKELEARAAAAAVLEENQKAQAKESAAIAALE